MKSILTLDSDDIRQAIAEFVARKGWTITNPLERDESIELQNHTDHAYTVNPDIRAQINVLPRSTNEQ